MDTSRYGDGSPNQTRETGRAAPEWSESDVLELLQERNRLQRENEALRSHLGKLVAAQEKRQGERLDLETHLRTALTPVWGYLQLLARRPRLLGDPTAARRLESIVLPPLRDAVEAVDKLDEHSEAEPGQS